LLRLFNKSMLFNHFFNLNNTTHYLEMTSFTISAGGGLPKRIPSLVGISIFVQAKVGGASSVETACSAFGLMIVQQDHPGRSTL